MRVCCIARCSLDASAGADLGVLAAGGINVSPAISLAGSSVAGIGGCCACCWLKGFCSCIGLAAICDASEGLDSDVLSTAWLALLGGSSICSPPM